MDIRQRFAGVWQSLSDDGYLERRAGQSVVAGGSGDRIALRREGLLRVDSLLQRFFLPEHRGVRYT